MVRGRVGTWRKPGWKSLLSLPPLVLVRPPLKAPSFPTSLSEELAPQKLRRYFPGALRARLRLATLDNAAVAAAVADGKATETARFGRLFAS